MEHLLEEDAAGPPAEALDLARRRDEARAERDYAEADRIRDELAGLGWDARDTAEGTQLVPRG
jgi:cysteinyl-tRNA synthetase